MKLDEPGPLQEQRLDAVAAQLRASGARTVLDLGCGPGELLVRLAADPHFEQLVGVDNSLPVLAEARRVLGLADAPRKQPQVRLLHGSFTEADARFAGFDAATLVETIEHLDPQRLSTLERAVFGCYRPGSVLLTTPNREYNVLYGMPHGTFRHPGHRFEWTRDKFRRWARGTAERNGYAVTLCGIGTPDETFGCPTQMAVFRQRPALHDARTV
jgi:3' terminal RNA ribose 2'-O-methyltransferase Hen1